jgi:type VI secretion system secreted protein Hcp
MATKVYLQFDDIKSTVAEPNHKGWVEMDSYSYSAHRSVSQTSGSSNRNISQASISSIKLTKKMNLATQGIFKQAHGGQPIEKCVLHLVGDGKTFMEYTLHKPIISDYEVHFTAANMVEPSETITIHFTRIDTRYIPTDASNGPINAGYDLEQAKVL